MSYFGLFWVILGLFWGYLFFLWVILGYLGVIWGYLGLFGVISDFLGFSRVIEINKDCKGIGVITVVAGGG